MKLADSSRLVESGIVASLAAGSLWLVATAAGRPASWSADFMPHGYCYRWDPAIVWLNVISDGLIALAYYCIPIALVYFIRRRRDLPFHRVFWMFGAFILACGTTHLMEIWNVWHGSYMLAGMIKAATAAVSVLTVAVLVPSVPQLVGLPGEVDLQRQNLRLEAEIAQREQAEAATKRVLRDLADHKFALDQHAIVATTGVQGSITYVNRKFCAISQYSKEELIGQNHRILNSGHHPKEFFEQMYHTIAGGEVWRGDICNRAKDGSLYWVDTTIVPFLEADGKPRQYTTIGDDITVRKRAEEARERLAAVVDSSDDAIITKDLKGTINAWNRGAEKIFGYTAAEVVGQPMLLLFPPDRVQEESDILARIGRGESVEHFETVRVRKDGRPIEVSTAISPVRDGSGVIVGASTIARDMTARNRAEAALRQSDARRKFALETAGLGDWELNLTTLEAARSFLHDKIFGYQPPLPEWSFEIFLRHVHPDDREKVREDFQSCVSQGRKWNFECRIVRLDGEIRWLWACGDHYREASGDTTHMFGIVEDITERKLEEAALRESEERFQAMVNGIPQLAWMAEPDGHIFWYNRRWYEYTGTTFEQMEGWGWQSVQDPDMLPKVLEGWKGAIAAGRSFDMEFPLRGVDGVFREFLTRVRPLKDGAGRVTRWFGTNTNISERKHAEEQLAEQAEELSRQAAELLRSRQSLEEQTRMLKLVLESMGEGLVASDREGHFLIWNDSATKLLGRGPNDLPTEQWSPYYGCYQPDGITPVPTAQLPLVRALNGESLQTDLIVRHPENEQGAFLEFMGRPMRDHEGVLCGGVVVFRDITDRKAAEREIKELNQGLEVRVAERTAQLQAANQELEAFTYSVSHDLRAPLRHMSGFSKILSEEYGPSLPAEAQRHLQRIENGTRRMGQLVDDLLNLAGVGRRALSLRVSELRPVVDEVIAELAPECVGRQIEWKMEDLPSLECDPTLIRQVFQNLIGNALKYSRPRSPAVIEIGKMQEDGHLVIFVRDNGVGFNMKYADKLFGVFQRLHRAEDFEGTGVGLSTVQRIVQKHGGRVWAEAELDKGATFYFTLGSSAASPEKDEFKTRAAIAGEQT